MSASEDSQEHQGGHVDGGEPLATQLDGRQVGTSALWSALSTSVLRASTFVVSLIIARIVAPYDFGVFTVALTVYTIMLSVADVGVSAAIVRHPTRSREIAPTVFTISLITCTLLSAVMVATAPTVARALGAADATQAIRVLSIVVLLDAFTEVPTALLSRDFMQREVFITNACSFVAYTVVILIFVLLGHPVLGLALSRVAGQLLIVVMMNWLTPERYWPGFSWREAKPLLRFGLPLAGSTLVTIATANTDFIVVGHVLGARQLGYYNLAFNISNWPVTIFGAVLVSVTLPTISRIRDSTSDLTRHLRAGLSALAAAALPVAALLAALAAPLIDVVYGERWHEAWKALVVLAVFGAARTVLAMFSDLLVALGLTSSLLVLQSVWLVALIPTMIFCVGRWGIFGAGLAHAVVVVFVVFPMYMLTVRRRTPLKIGWVKNAMASPLLASVAMAAAAYGGTRLVGPQLLQILVGLTFGILTYGLIAGYWLLRLRTVLIGMYWKRETPASSVDIPTTELAMENREFPARWEIELPTHASDQPLVRE